MGILDFIFPRVCVGCRKEGAYICPDCQRKLTPPPAICPMCSRPSVDGWTHARCRTSCGMERLMVGLRYRGMVQQLLKKVKYKNSWDIIPFLFSLCHFLQLPCALVTSVPMYAQKERERGFNQAEMIAQLLAKQNKDPTLVLLVRGRPTRPMYGLTKKERQENIQGAFRIQKKCHCDTVSRIILVDDVWTTGATMRECTRVLKQAGVGEVWGVALAR